MLSQRMRSKTCGCPWLSTPTLTSKRQLTEWSTYFSVKREGSFTRSGYELVDETEIFKGNESTLIMRQSYTYEFQCIYHLGRYPFDTQVKIAKLIFLIPQKCSIEMNVLSVNQKSVTLLPSILKMNQALDMMLFVITEYELTNFTSAHGGIKTTIRMQLINKQQPTAS